MIQVKTTKASPERTYKSYFSVRFADLEMLLCSQTKLVTPQKMPDGIATTVHDEKPYMFTIPEIEDSSTQYLEKNCPSLNLLCGPYTVKITSGAYIAQQSPTNMYAINVQTGDEKLVGDRKFEIFIQSNRYGYIYWYMWGKVKVLPCIVKELVDPEDTAVSPFIVSYEIPAKMSVQLPVYLPEPTCAMNNTDVSYTFEGKVPEWVKMNPRKRTVEIDVDNEDLMNTATPIRINTVLEKVKKQMSFVILFSDTPPTFEVQADTAEEEKEEKKEEEPKPTKPAPAWDGWKVLLEPKALLPQGVVLPPPIDEPDYVPTPPVPKMNSVSPRGVTRIEFSEDVFAYEDLKNKLVPVPIEGRRRLQDSDFRGVTRMMPMIEVYVEPGDESDPSKLGFNSRIEFVSNRTIEIELLWDNPPFVSANQPEDELVIKLNGPIYD